MPAPNVLVSDSKNLLITITRCALTAVVAGRVVCGLTPVKCPNGQSPKAPGVVLQQRGWGAKVPNPGGPLGTEAT